VPGERPDADDDARVHGRDRRRQQGVDECAADDDVDVEQPVPQDRDRHDDGDAVQGGKRLDDVRDRQHRLPGRAGQGGQDPGQLAGCDHRCGQGQPLRLLPPPGVTRPVPGDQGCER